MFGDLDSSILVPPTINMLEGDNSFLFLAKHKSKILDQCVLECAREQSIPAYLDGSFPNLELSEDCFTAIHDQSNWIIRRFFRKTPEQLPVEIVGSLRFDTVYSSSLEPIARCPEGRNLLWKVGTRDVRNTLVGDGWTRCAAEVLFKSRWLYPYAELTLNCEYGFEIWEHAWLAQSSRVTSVLGLVEMDLAMILTPPNLTLRGKPFSGQYVGLVAFFKLCDGEEPPPVYLFIHPPPTCISELISWLNGTTAYFWSFDETGQTCLSDDECEEWGIPKLELSCWGPHLLRWPAEVYQALHDWQVVQGFDPTTADFARHLGIPELEILGPTKKTERRFEEIREEETGKNSYASVGVQTEGRRASEKKADVPSKSAVRPALLQQSRSAAIATNSMEEASPRRRECSSAA
ncbi:hypothetical protein VNI00_002381 [Paramarasmius palmivorus]|uniref:Uncharacterized protein n=1 Tax=Paramarasmius palmivorus TaxID=297713 RepID=A0AAW0DV62_9AGAR